MTSSHEPRFPDRRSRTIAWRGLVLGVFAQLSYTFAVTGPAFLIPHLRAQEGYTLAQGGMVGTATSIGMVLTLVVWGALSDRRGERLALVLGLFLNSAAIALGLVLVWGVAVGGLGPAIQARMMRQAGVRHRTTAGTLMPVAMNLGIAAGSALGSGVLERASLDGLAPVAIVPTLLALMGFTVLGRAVRDGADRADRLIHKRPTHPAKIR